jgi:polyvinyl alcohol dehydrogenase (cytochrome)
VPARRRLFNWAFAGGNPQLFQITVDGQPRDVVGMAQKSGIYWAFDADSGATLWQTADPQWAADYAAPTVANGVVYVGSLERTRDQMFALDAASGEILWQFAAGGSVAAHPAIADGMVYWGSGFTTFWNGTANNKLYGFSPDGR